MITLNKIHWGKCLSNVIYEKMHEGFPKDWMGDRQVHFFWGLGQDNPKKIHDCMRNGWDYFIIDIGYLSNHIKRYPAPSILDPDTTYMRFSKGNLHNNVNKIHNDPTRLIELQRKGIFYANELQSYNENAEVSNKWGHVLVTPSSETVTRWMNSQAQLEWQKETIEHVKKTTTRPVVFRNKPRPDNKWWGTTIQSALKGASALVTNMSLCSIDAVVAGVPIICDKTNIAAPLASSHSIDDINNLKLPKQKTLADWMARAANCQFNLEEIRNGTARKYLEQNYYNGNEQNVSALSSVVDGSDSSTYSWG